MTGCLRAIYTMYDCTYAINKEYIYIRGKNGRTVIDTSGRAHEDTFAIKLCIIDTNFSAHSVKYLVSFYYFIEKRKKKERNTRIKLFYSFVQEFASPPADGITLLLETLRGVQLAQSSPPSSGHTGPRVGTRRAALDELGCVECLAACTERCSDAPRLLVQAQPGLLALAVCLTSSLNRSRVLALQVTIVTSVPSISLGYC